MDKINFEKLDDNFINLYEVWIFIKSLEFSALKLNEFFWYKLTFWIDKKSHFLYFEVWFPKTRLDERINEIVKSWYSIRYFPKNSLPIIYNWKNIFKKDEKDLVDRKQNIIKLA